MRAIAAVLLAALCASAETGGEILARDAKALAAWKAAPVTLTGRVVDEDGFGVAAEVAVQDRKAAADKRGWFRIDALARRNALVRVGAEGFFVEFRVADLALPAGQDAADLGTVRLRARAPGRVRLVFGGDAMMTRRFFKPDTIESPPAPVLRPDSLHADAAAVLADVAPVLREADLAVLNLETVVGDAPGDPVSRKEHNFLTPPGALDAFADAGVDAFTLGNNHCWDFGEAGLKRTLEELGKRGILSCGAGANEAAARRPAELRAGTAKFLLLSYSGVRGSDVPLLAEGGRGGAAPMETEAILADVLAAAGRAPVIVALHTGTEYASRPTRRARDAAYVAAGGGAALVVGHHAHTPQGLALVEGVLVARCLGNFAFDQSRYEALPGLLLVADFEDGRVSAARLFPILNDDYRVRAAAGPVARWVARRVGALSEGVDVAWRAGGVEVALEPGERASS
ncbi:MAG: CapA family protein [Planctomycetia bacterium]|nr:CapA family protein [Planctomycetia bacterium]